MVKILLGWEEAALTSQIMMAELRTRMPLLVQMGDDENITRTGRRVNPDKPDNDGTYFPCG